jgi:hypothetical protein
MWGGIIGWFKNLFGAKGSSQIGSGNKAVSGGTSAGQNSPVVTAGGNVVFNTALPPPVDDGAEVFAELEDVIPDFLADLRKNLAEKPLLRVLIVLDKKSIAYNWPDDHLMYSADEEPNIWAEVQLLQNHGLLREEKPRFAYRIRERLAKYLRGAKVGG